MAKNVIPQFLQFLKFLEINGVSSTYELESRRKFQNNVCWIHFSINSSKILRILMYMLKKQNSALMQLVKKKEFVIDFVPGTKNVIISSGVPAFMDLSFYPL